MNGTTNPSRPPSATDIVAAYLVRLCDEAAPTAPVVPSHKIELGAVTFGARTYGVTHTPGTYARRFRVLKADPVRMAAHGIVVEEVRASANPAKARAWRITRVAP